MWHRVSGLASLALAGTVVGLAASLAFAAGSLGASQMTVPRCTSAGLRIIQNLSGSNVISVTVSNLPAGCGGATIHATVNNGDANSSGSNAVPGGGGSVTVTLASSVAATTTHQIDIVLTGP